MEIKIGISNCKCDQTIIEKIITRFLPNSNPKNFQILKVEQWNYLIIVLIKYPDCTNYKGEKLLVFENITENQLRKLEFIYPHFCEKYKHISPIAMFEPTERGFKMARIFINCWEG